MKKSYKFFFHAEGFNNFNAGLLICILFIFTALTLAAQETDKSVSASSELILQISTLPEAKLGFSHSIRFTVLQGESALTQGNNLKLNFTGEISPVSLNGIVRTVFTPVAFLEFQAGIRLGTGWNIVLFGSDVYGNGFNLEANPGKADGKPFDALLWKAHFGGTFQFDYAAVAPGDWNHVVMQTYHEINYNGNTRAKNNEAWFFEADSGENRNGFNYYGNLLIGYQMPIFLNTVAFLMEMDLYLYDTPGRSVWGDDMIRWKFSNVLIFTVTEKMDIALITQFRTARNFTSFDWKEKHFTQRVLNTSNPYGFEFYRVAAAVTYKL